MRWSRLASDSNDLAAHGDAASLRQDAMPPGNKFFGHRSRDPRNRPTWRPQARRLASHSLLKADGTEPLARAEFLCGVLGRQGQTRRQRGLLSQSAAGQLRVVTMDATFHPGRLYRFLRDCSSRVGDWKLGGFYVRWPSHRHDGNCFADRARELKAKGQNHNALVLLW